jgi:hypothetical protein
MSVLPGAGHAGRTSPGARRRSSSREAWPRATPSFYTAIDCHSLGIYTAIVLSLLSLSARMTVSPLG